jgi:hypothetical protein
MTFSGAVPCSACVRARARARVNVRAILMLYRSTHQALMAFRASACERACAHVCASACSALLCVRVCARACARDFHSLPTPPRPPRSPPLTPRRSPPAGGFSLGPSVPPAASSLGSTQYFSAGLSAVPAGRSLCRPEFLPGGVPLGVSESGRTQQ